MTTNVLLSAERLEWSQRRLVKAKNTNFKVNAKNKSWGKIIFPKFKAQPAGAVLAPPKGKLVNGPSKENDINIQQ